VYKPEQKISRVEFLKILLNTAQADVKTCTTNEKNKITEIFSDVPSEEWFAEFVCTGYKSGFINGYEIEDEEGNKKRIFKPAQEISLAEAAKIISLAQDLTVDTSTESGEWFAPFLKTLNNQKALKSNVQNSPEKQISREKWQK
jgi:hypothetical protein